MEIEISFATKLVFVAQGDLQKCGIGVEDMKQE
jgi:hypothetical protein